MSTVINLTDARARIAGLPSDDGVAQDLIDEQESWLARQLGGPLIGDRTESFYVGGGATFAGNYFGADQHRSWGKLGLARYTDAVILTDGGAAVAADQFTLIDRGSGVIRSALSVTRVWTGPYVTAQYAPNDELEVRAALYELLAIEASAIDQPVTGLVSEQLGDYAYTRATGLGIDQSRSGRKAAIVASIKPKRDSLVNLAVSRPAGAGDPVINRAEYHE